MFRPLLAASLIALSAPALADTVTSSAKVDKVTIYPGLAKVSRIVTLDLPAGQHDIIVPDLPANLSPEGIRLFAPETLRLGAVSLSSDRLPVTPDPDTAAIIAAKAEVTRLENILRQRNDDIAAIRLRVQAAEEQLAFLRSLSQNSAQKTLTASSIDDIRALSEMVGSQALAIKQAAFTAEQEAKAAERAREDDEKALADARQALAALNAPQDAGAVLSFTVETATTGQTSVTIDSFEFGANWAPVYDMRLSTKDTPVLDIDRSVVISQETGQDWENVQLVLSTARPGEQIAPSPIFARPRRIISEEDLAKSGLVTAQSRTLADGVASMMMEAPVAMEEATATTNFNGATVSYDYPGRVDIRNGVDDLRLPLDQLQFDARVWAQAVPARDTIAYRMAEFSNTSDEILLPGDAIIFTDGTMIGFDALPLVAAGADIEMGFGPLDGIRLTRTVPNRSEGDKGVFSSANQLKEAAILKIENLTTQPWDILLRDAVPYSEQDDLQVDISATPQMTRVDPAGRRGILEWDIAVPAGQTAEVALDYTLTWPNGYVLQ